jgi:hypothetical protein
MMKAVALVALSLALEAGFLFQVAAPAGAPAVSSGADVARAASPVPSRG